MFKRTRWHRWLTVPALVAALASVLRADHPHLALLCFPPLAAMPLQLAAAADPTARSIARALTATRVVGFVMIAWGLFVTVLAAPAGILVLGATAGLGFAASGTSEARLAATVSLTGGLLVIASVPLIWMGAAAFAVLPAAGALFLGSIVWAIEAVQYPGTPQPELPTAIAL